MQLFIMCNDAVIKFVKDHINADEIAGKAIIEFGALNVNGTARHDVELLNPREYLGVDIMAGKGVDIVCDVSNAISSFGIDSFDVIITTEMMEHVAHWQDAIHNMKGILKCGGILILTTRSKGFKYHGYPFDYWRYEEEDMRNIFSDCIIEKIEKDQDSPGILVKIRKPDVFKEKDIVNYKLYSIITNRKQSNVNGFDVMVFRIKTQSIQLIKKVTKFFGVFNILKQMLKRG